MVFSQVGWGRTQPQVSRQGGDHEGETYTPIYTPKYTPNYTYTHTQTPVYTLTQTDQRSDADSHWGTRQSDHAQFGTQPRGERRPDVRDLWCGHKVGQIGLKTGTFSVLPSLHLAVWLVQSGDKNKIGYSSVRMGVGLFSEDIRIVHAHSIINIGNYISAAKKHHKCTHFLSIISC